MSLLLVPTRIFSKMRPCVQKHFLALSRSQSGRLSRRQALSKTYGTSATMLRKSLPEKLYFPTGSLLSPKISSSVMNIERRRFGASKVETEEEYDEDEDEEDLDEREWHLVYEGAMSGPLKRIKMVSITTCTLSMITMPLLALYGNQDVALAGRIAVAFTAGIFGMGTTAFVHFIGKTYVSELWKKLEFEGDDIEDVDPEEISTLLRAETFSLFGTKKVVEFDLDDVEQGDSRPFCSFKVHGNNYFLHHEPEAWIDGESGVIEELFTRPIEAVEDRGSGEE